ncbi:PREDICTED: protein FAM72A-like [Amphimedon queenslandica]|uniref:Protein FAM72A n=1 Tax=Amphimedon queenslandica TaxID=400682 RepID=A0A1X7VRU6_AMPQE|nr:PREDICTED: protein FAM72A-like [Amphimedon queenslandica]|eukprot:XP_003382986.1 PREDICTED: protein FAM72A-like [Amphimedon queenslandica]
MSGLHQDCHMHPSFKTKPVYELNCSYCDHLVCVRGMRAILLADKTVELYSTDQPPPGMLLLVGPDYQTNNCQCKIQDTACCGCGCMVGYHVTVPCHSCLRSCNNGHFWMYHSNSVRPSERLDSTGKEIMVWASVPPSSNDEKMVPYKLPLYIECCR